MTRPTLPAFTPAVRTDPAAVATLRAAKDALAQAAADPATSPAQLAALQAAEAAAWDAVHHPGQPARVHAAARAASPFPLNVRLPVQRTPDPEPPERILSMPNPVLVNGAHDTPSTLLCRGCGEPHVDVRGVCWNCYEAVAAGRLGGHVLAPLLAGAAGDVTIFSTSTAAAPATCPDCGKRVGAAGNYCRQCSPKHRRADVARAARRTEPASVEAPPVAVDPAPPQGEPARLAPPKHLSLDRLIADLARAKAAHAAAATQITALEHEIRRRIPADLLTSPQKES